jgi:hydroxymethylpyrimidine pyrophosphatase-like HAD family hydrolase
MIKDLLVDISRTLDHTTLHLIARGVKQFEKVDSGASVKLSERLAKLLAPAGERLATAGVKKSAIPVLLRLLQETSGDEITRAFEWLPQWPDPCTLISFDIDGTLRAHRTSSNELPPATLGAFKLLFQDFPDMRFIVATNHTLDDSKGFLFEGFGEERFGGGRFTLVYEQGAGVFTPKLGSSTKISLIPPPTAKSRQLLDAVRIRIMESCSKNVDCSQFHLQGNEFNVTIKPNFLAETPEAEAIVREAGGVMLQLLAGVIAEQTKEDPVALTAYLKTYYASENPSLRSLKTDSGSGKLRHPQEVEALASSLALGYYPAEAVELTSREVTKLDGFTKARHVLQHASSPVLALGDSPSDFPIFEYLVDHHEGIIACPDAAKDAILEYVTKHRGVVYPRGAAEDVLHAVFAFNHLRALVDAGHISETG